MKGTFRFYKTADNRWYIDLPDWGGALADLEMVEGADTMLDKVSSYSNECHLEMSSEPLQGADQLKLVNDLRKSIGGGEYLMERYKGETVNHKMWLCEVTETVFGELPKMIYVRYPD
ncbi:MAG: DUF6717 family protein [Bacteroidota bacterium]